MSFSVYILFEMRYKDMNNFKNMLIICIIFTEHGARSTEHGACTHACTTHGARSTEHGARSMHARMHDARSMEHGARSMHARTHDARSTEHARMHARTEHGAWNNDVLFKLDEITNTVCRFIKFYFSIFNNKIIVLESH